MAPTIEKLSSHLGAQATGVDLRGALSTTDRDALNRAFVENSVLAIRDQQLAPQQMVAAVENLSLIHI